MTHEEAVVKIIGLLEAYYGVKYRDAVKIDVRDYLLEKSQDVTVALFETVKRRHSTQYREPPCVAVMEKIYETYEDDIFYKLEHDRSGIINKGLLQKKILQVENKTDEGNLIPKENAEKYFDDLKKRFSGENDNQDGRNNLGGNSLAGE